MTLPLILARRLDPGLEAAELRGLDQDAAEALCDRIAATGALDEVRDGPRPASGAPRASSTPDFTEEERELLGMIADGVVERYS